MDELKLLEAEAAAADRAIAESNAELLAANDPQMQDAGPVIDDEAELRGLVELAAAMLGPVLPKTAAVAKQQAPAMAAAGAEVMRLHGWTMGGVMAKYAPYIALIVAVAPVASTARAEVAAQKEAAAQQKQAANDGDYQQKSTG
jgi:hypothetical protein